MENCKDLKQIELARDAAQEKRASEPSQVAKQAAAEWRKTVARCSDRDANMFAYGYDAKTAKAREELENERFTRAHWEDRAEKAERLLAHKTNSEFYNWLWNWTLGWAIVAILLTMISHPCHSQTIFERNPFYQEPNLMNTQNYTAPAAWPEYTSGAGFWGWFLSAFKPT